MHSAVDSALPPPTPRGFLQKFGEIAMLCFIPIGLLQFLDSAGQWEYLQSQKPLVVSLTMTAILLLSAGLAWFWQSRGRGERLHDLFQTLCVLYLALSISGYGAAKILGTQFQPPHYVLDTPIGELGGFWLTWTFYGYSHAMALILGWTQIIGATLILFRASRLIGVFVLLPVMANIDLINGFYHISPLANFNALHYTFFLVVLLLVDWPVLKAVFLAYRDGARIRFPRLLLSAAKLLVIVLAFVQVIQLKSLWPHGVKLLGVYKVDSLLQQRQMVIPSDHRGAVWSKLYIEWRYGCVFKYDPDRNLDKDLGGQYTIDEKASVITVKFYSDDKQDSLQAHYNFVTDSTVVMRGRYKKDSVLLYLRKLPDPPKAD
ncbi:MAG TPA: hypothetical protein VKR41_01885 [Puia sp.]|nr:hypothetical protein [Puia sp.]